MSAQIRAIRDKMQDLINELDRIIESNSQTKSSTQFAHKIEEIVKSRQLRNPGTRSRKASKANGKFYFTSIRELDSEFAIGWILLDNMAFVTKEPVQIWQLRDIRLSESYLRLMANGPENRPERWAQAIFGSVHFDIIREE